MTQRLSIQVKDYGYKAFKKRVTDPRPIALTVGVHADADGDYEGVSVLEIANFHEFGIGNPQRSFIRAWVEENRDEIDRAVNHMAELVTLGKIDRAAAVDQLGTLFVASIQKRISAGIDPPNEQSTIDRKGSSTPLIDTNQLRASIDYKDDSK